MPLDMRPGLGEAMLQAPALSLTPCAPRRHPSLLGPQFPRLYSDEIGLEDSKDMSSSKILAHSFSSIYRGLGLYQHRSTS